MRNSNIKYLFAFYIFFITANPLFCQSSKPPFYYCYSPPMPQHCRYTNSDHQEHEIAFSVYHLDSANFLNTTFQISIPDNTYSVDDMILTHNAPYPIGDIVNTELSIPSLLKITTNPFATEDSLLVFLNIFDHEDVRFIGPIVFRRFYNVKSLGYYDSVCSAWDRSWVISNPLRQDTVLSGLLLKKRIFPNADALKLMEALNKDVYYLNKLPSGYTIKNIPFVPIGGKKTRIFRKRARRDNKWDRRQGDIFLQNVMQFDSLFRVHNQNNPLNSSPLVIDYKKDLTRFHDLLSDPLGNYTKIKKGTLTIVNSELHFLNIILISNSIRGYLAAISYLTPDIERLLLPYTKSSSKTVNVNYKTNHGALWAADNASNSVLEADENLENGRYLPPTNQEGTEDKKLRRFNFYIWRSEIRERLINNHMQKTSILLMDSTDVMGQYNVYCVPVGIYQIYERGVISFKDLSIYSCSEKASVANKCLPYGSFYFFATSAATSKLVSEPTIYSTGSISKNQNGKFLPRKYAYPIVVKQ